MEIYGPEQEGTPGEPGLPPVRLAGVVNTSTDTLTPGDVCTLRLNASGYVRAVAL